MALNPFCDGTGTGTIAPMISANVKCNPNPNPNPNLNPYPTLNKNPIITLTLTLCCPEEISSQDQLSPEQMSDHLKNIDLHVCGMPMRTPCYMYMYPFNEKRLENQVKYLITLTTITRYHSNNLELC